MSTKLDKKMTENEAKIEQFTFRVEKLVEKRTGLAQRLKALREARKEDLVNGVNVDSLTKEINHITGQEQLFDDELQGLQEAITVLQSKGTELKAAIEAERLDVLNNECVKLARELNNKFSELAPVVTKYNEMLRQTRNVNAGGKLYFGDQHSGEAEIRLRLPKIFIRGELDCDPAYLGYSGRLEHNFLQTYLI